MGYSGSTSKATSSRKVDANRRNAQHSETGLLCPEVGTHWNATAFSPVTRPYYVAALGRCSAKLVCGRGKESNLEEQAGKKYLRALDIETGNVFWETPQIGAVDGKRNARALVTAGWILFYGDPSGNVVALNERNGMPLWYFPTSGICKPSPITYTVGGKPYVPLAVGPNILSFGLP